MSVLRFELWASIFFEGIMGLSFYFYSESKHHVIFIIMPGLTFSKEMFSLSVTEKLQQEMLTWVCVYINIRYHVDNFFQEPE